MSSANKGDHEWEHQIWEIGITFIPIFLVVFLAITISTWNIGTDWGSFTKHWPYIWKSTLGGFDNQDWHYYKHLLQSQGYLLAFYLHTGLPAVIAFLTASWATWNWIISPPKPNDRHIAGPRLIPSDRVKGHAVTQLKKESQNKNSYGINLHPHIQLPIKRELGNVLALGMQGSGKSVVLKSLLTQIITRGDRVLVYDQKREYTTLFFDNNAVMISPTDARSTPWNIAADANSDEMALLIASSLIRETKEPIWGNGSRLIFAGCISILNKTMPAWGWRDLSNLMILPEYELRELLQQHFPRASRLIQNESKTTEGFFSTILSELGWVFTLSEAWPDSYERGFSITKWLASEEKPVLIIPADQKFSSLSDSLCVALLTLMISHVLDLPDSDNRKIWFAIDELGNLPKCSSLEAWLSLGRSKGARTIAGTQNISQLQNVYDHLPAETLLGLFNNIIALKMGSSGESANVVSRALGVRDIERLVITRDADGRESKNWQRERDIPLVAPDTLKHLPQADKHGVHGYATIGGWNAVYQLCWPYPKTPKMAEPFVPAAWLSSPKPAAKEKIVHHENDVVEVQPPEEPSWRGRGRRRHHCSEDVEGDAC